jgi:hypothetical protein
MQVRVRMPDLVVRGMDTMLLERVRRLAISRGWSHRQAVTALVECGLFYIDMHPGNGFASPELDVLQEAVSALERLPRGGDF